MLSLATYSKKIKKSSSSKKQHSKDKSPCQPSTSVQKSSHFSRIFTGEDEVKILEAVLELRQDNPIPAKVAAVIFNGIQDKITAQVNVTQLGEKIRKLRDKYCKERNAAELNSHQEELSILCKKIWGFKKTPAKLKMFKDDDMRSVKEEDFVKNYPYLMMEVSKASNNFVTIDTLRYLDGSMLQKLNERWGKLHTKELLMLLERLDLTEEYVKLVLDAHTSTSKGKDVVDDEEEAMAVDDADDADDELVGDDDDENEQSEDVDNEEKAEVEDDDDDENENEKSDDVVDEEKAEVEVGVDSDDE